MANIGTQLVGKKFGRLTVLRQDGRHHWCQCECGSPPRKFRTDHLKDGNTRSCGCLKKDASGWLRKGPQVAV